MKEFKNILKEYDKIDFTKNRAALATVVKVKGSSYRSPGARMLITDDGRWVGSISGGCLEGDALRKARAVMTDQVPRTVTYDTREESNQQLGIGLGCNGVIDVLIEPIDPADENNPVKNFNRFVDTVDPVVMATVFHAPSADGQKILMRREEVMFSSLTDQGLTNDIITDLADLYNGKQSFAKTYRAGNETVEVFLELIVPGVNLIIFGGGFDARPVSQLAKTIGWGVTVTDECVAHIAPVFFPSADRLTLCDRTFVERDFNITPYTACVLMSHNYDYDRDVLRSLLKTPAPYIGILGPRKRFDKMKDAFAAEGIELSKDDHHRIHSPIGLDIGAEAPDEIAVSIIAEIQGKLASRSGGFLKYREGPIHQRDTASDQVLKQMYVHDPVMKVKRV